MATLSSFKYIIFQRDLKADALHDVGDFEEFWKLWQKKVPTHVNPIFFFFSKIFLGKLKMDKKNVQISKRKTFSPKFSDSHCIIEIYRLVTKKITQNL